MTEHSKFYYKRRMSKTYKKHFKDCLQPETLNWEIKRRRKKKQITGRETKCLYYKVEETSIVTSETIIIIIKSKRRL